MAKKKVQIKVKDVARVWNELNDLVALNENPFKGKARRMLFKLQPEAKFLRESTQKDIKAVENEVIDLGEPIPPPDDFPDEYEDTISKVCTGVPKKESQIAKLLKK